MGIDIKLETFKAQVRDVARPNRFWVTINPIVGGNSFKPEWKEENMAFLAKSAGLPSRTIGDVELNWQGMKAKLAGDPTFDDFTMSFLNDYAFNLKAFFEDWVESIATMDTNNRTRHENYKTIIKVQQLGRQATEVLRTYELIGAYPKQMDQIELSMESNDTPEELSITFAFDTFRVTKGAGSDTAVD